MYCPSAAEPSLDKEEMTAGSRGTRRWADRDGNCTRPGLPGWSKCGGYAGYRKKMSFVFVHKHLNAP